MVTQRQMGMSRLQMLSAINLSAAANRQKGTNYFIKAGKSRSPDILFLGKIYHTLFSVDHWIKIQVYLSPSSEQAPVPPGCLSTEYPPLRILFLFQKILLTTGNFSADSQPVKMAVQGEDLWEAWALLQKQGEVLLPASSGMWVWASKLKSKFPKGSINSSECYCHTFIILLLYFYSQAISNETRRLLKTLRAELRMKIPWEIWKWYGRFWSSRGGKAKWPKEVNVPPPPLPFAAGRGKGKTLWESAPNPGHQNPVHQNTDVLTCREVTHIRRAATLQRLLCTPAGTDRE